MSTPLRVLVAGCRGGIGAACERLLRKRGARTFGVDRPECDIAGPGGAELAVDRSRDALGGLDGIVHAVGMSGRRLGDGPVTAATDEAWSEIIRVNLESAFRLLRAGMPALREAGGGSFVIVGSTLGQAADRDFLTAAYAASKAGLLGLARTAALEGAAWQVRVNVIAAGLVQTPMAARAASDEQIQSRLGELQPLGAQMIPPDLVAQAAAWLLSPDSGATTGIALPVDAGWSIR